MVRAFGALVATGVLLRVAGLERARRRAANRPTKSGHSSLRPERMARLLHLAARHGPYRPACLVRSLALQRLLHRDGFAADLRIGVRKQDGALEAHAWLEHDGRRLLDADGESDAFTAFEALPRDPG